MHLVMRIDSLGVFLEGYSEGSQCFEYLTKSVL
jgi:hypothetical protein